MHTFEEIRGWIGRDVFASYDTRIGSLVGVRADRQTGAPEWLSVVIAEGAERRAVPVEGAVPSGRAVRVPYRRARAAHAVPVRRAAPDLLLEHELRARRHDRRGGDGAADRHAGHGLEVARLDYTQSGNDRRNSAYAKRTIRGILEGAGAQDILVIDRYAHLIGGARMGSSPEDSVCDADHRIWGVPNVFIKDGSALPTQGAANPALTLMAESSRIAEVLAGKRLQAQLIRPRVASRAAARASSCRRGAGARARAPAG